MKRSHISSSRSYSRPAISVLGICFLFLLGFTLTPRKSSDWSSGSDPNPRLRSFSGKSEIPRFAYLVTGTKGDGARVKRLVRAIHHQRNYYLLHLDLEASDEERLELAKYVRSEKMKNVMVMGMADLVTEKGPTMLANTLHGVAIMLKKASDWDWFINLSASDYPLMPQDDILHIFSYLPRYLNFIEHTSNIAWKENQRARPIIIDPGLYHMKKSGVFWAKERRSLPASFKLFMGSTSVALTRSFLEFCIWGWENLPRTLLMYYTNFLLSPEGYFHTVICNSKDYQNTTVNHDLHYSRWNEILQQGPMNLTVEDFREMVESGAPFAREFPENDRVLDKIDEELLRIDSSGFELKPLGVVKPTVSSKRLEKLMARLLGQENFRPKQCK
ncbi:PREDICTED: beta-glucuronosyltransferase GlcAT14C [Tarenaya hassleriana]|uniref:beta-glucuronosyltransferase GlcAT14C n=1 Tax=Tarenaya hassleriana TaxID=28532 RepID=UPI00053C1BFE|nr:PREDICTED: beta-glucuronosyltransferase GlcAT14C [Tarenaya hassleriana]